MNFNLYNILMLVGAIQGIVFSSIVFLSLKYRNRSLFFLAALILCIALNNLQYFLLDSAVISVQEFFGVFYIPLSTLSMVLFFFYVKFFLFPESKMTSADKLLFLPFLLFLLLIIFYKTVLALGLMTAGITFFFGELIFIHELIALLFSVGVLLLIFSKVLRFEKMTKNIFPPKITWLKYTAGISLFLCFVYAFSIFKDMTSSASGSNFFYFLWISQSFVIYWLGHVGIYKYGFAEGQQVNKSYANSQKGSVSLPFKNEHISAFKKFVVEDKNYLNSELTLDMVAENLGLSKSYLSRMINAELRSSYTDYINSLRVEEAKLNIQNPESEKFTLIAIGLEAGFNSKSAFNSAFKKFTGFTPSEFKKIKNNA